MLRPTSCYSLQITKLLKYRAKIWLRWLNKMGRLSTVHNHQPNRISLAFTKLLKSKWILLLPYIIGVLWTICHPIVSVITGESKCRGAYIDEIQFDSFG